jgi:hypothetical protein
MKGFNMSTYRKKVKVGSLIILHKRILKAKFLEVKKSGENTVELFNKAKRVAIRKIQGSLDSPYFVFDNHRYNLDLG